MMKVGSRLKSKLKGVFPGNFKNQKPESSKPYILQSFHSSVRGASHIKTEKGCQDYAISSSCGKYAVAIVCDGHGGERYIRSNIGSRIAAETCMKAIIDFFENQNIKSENEFGKKSEKVLTQLIANIIFRWREDTGKDFYSNPFTEAETAKLSPGDKSKLEGDGWIKAYGTTLIAVVRATDFWFGLHIGDGKCVVVSENGEFLEPIPWDDKCFMNTTTSLCDSDAIANFRYYFSNDDLPLALFVGTDGIDDSFNGTQGLHSFYESLLKTIKAKGIEEGVKDLNEYLPKVSEKGSGDDVSVAGIVCSTIDNK